MTQAAPVRLRHPDWLYHHLSVEGPAEPVARWRAAAAGPGIVPWQLDTDRMEEDWFHRLLGAGSLSQQGAEILARQLREAVVERNRRALASAAHSRACPFDLHALVPVPGPILALGPDHPDAIDFLWTHWGTAEPLRHVSLADDPAATALHVTFWSADWTPWRALSRLRTDWPDLRFDMRPEYAPR